MSKTNQDRAEAKFAAAINRLHAVAADVLAGYPYAPPTPRPANGDNFDAMMRIPISELGDSALVSFLDAHRRWSTAYAIDRHELGRQNRITLQSSTGPSWPIDEALARFGYSPEEVAAALAANEAEAAGRRAWDPAVPSDGACECGGGADPDAYEAFMACPKCPKTAVVDDVPFDEPRARPRFEELRRLAYNHGAVAAAVCFPASLNLHRLPLADPVAALGRPGLDDAARDGVVTIACHGGPDGGMGRLAVSLTTRGVAAPLALTDTTIGRHVSWLQSLMP
jgi:hypothetical protein